MCFKRFAAFALVLSLLGNGLLVTESFAKDKYTHEIGVHFFGIEPNAGGAKIFGGRFRWRLMEVGLSLYRGSYPLLTAGLRKDFNEESWLVPHIFVGIGIPYFPILGAGLNIRLFSVFGSMCGIRLDNYIMMIQPFSISYLYALGLSFAY